MGTKIIKYGREGELEIIWSPVIKWASGVFAALLVAGVISAIADHQRLGVVQSRQDDVRKHIETEDYIHRMEYDTDQGDIKDTLRRIEEKIDGNAAMLRHER